MRISSSIVLCCLLLLIATILNVQASSSSAAHHNLKHKLIQANEKLHEYIKNLKKNNNQLKKAFTAGRSEQLIKKKKNSLLNKAKKLQRVIQEQGASLTDLPVYDYDVIESRNDLDTIESRSDSLSMGSASGKASYYSNSFNGRKTANGETFSNSASTCAHKTLPFGTMVTVKNPANGRTARCRVNDRGPYSPGRIIDLTSTVFSRLATLSAGVLNVQISY